jgi:hypothetical protein
MGNEAGAEYDKRDRSHQNATPQEGRDRPGFSALFFAAGHHRAARPFKLSSTGLSLCSVSDYSLTTDGLKATRWPLRTEIETQRLRWDLEMLARVFGLRSDWKGAYHEQYRIL